MVSCYPQSALNYCRIEYDDRRLDDTMNYIIKETDEELSNTLKEYFHMNQFYQLINSNNHRVRSLDGNPKSPFFELSMTRYEI